MAKGLEGIRVLELGGGVSAPYAAKLLGDMGATVVKVEPPGGDPSRQRGPFRNGKPDPEASGLFLALNANKRSVVLDLDTEQGQGQLDTLAAQADILVHNFRPQEMAAKRIDYERFAALQPALVMVSITPFGLTGPRKDWAGTELTGFHASASGWVFADPEGAAGRPPVKFFGHQADIQAGIYGIVAALGAYYGAARHGGEEQGHGEHIDVSVHQVNSSFHGPNFVEWTYAGRIINRFKPRLFAPAAYYKCKEGYLFIVCPEEDQWARLVTLLGDPAWAKEERFKTGWDRGAHLEDLNAKLEALTTQWDAEELYHACQANHICATRLYEPGDLFDQEHLKARGFIQEQNHPVAGKLPMPGAPFKMKDAWWRIQSPAPLLGEANGELAGLFGNGNGANGSAGNGRAAGANGNGARKGNGGRLPLPLEGVKVLDMTWYWAGPHCTELLAHLGADVIKIESAKRPDFTRRFNIFPKGMEAGLNRGGFFNEYGQSKRSIAVDIKHPDGVALIKELAKECDIAASNFSTGVMDRFGLGADELLRINPEMIVLTVSGFGQSGPLKNYIAYGPTVVPLAGIIANPDRDGVPPLYAANGYGDPHAGVCSAYGVLAALVARLRNGGGQYIDASLWESMISNGFEGWINAALGNAPYPYMGNRDPVYAPHNCFPSTGDDKWVAIAVTSDAEWQGLCRAMGNAALRDDPRFRTAEARKANEAALEELLSAWTREQSREEATRRLQAEGVPAHPVLDTAELADDDHLEARGFFSRIPHPEVGTQQHTGIPWLLHNAPNGVRERAPLLGEHTDQVLQERLRRDPAEIARLRAAAAIW